MPLVAGKFMRRTFVLHGIAIILPILCGLALLIDFQGVASRSRDLSLDSYTRIQPFEGDPEIAEQLVFVDVDEASLKAFGQWPWPRHYLAVLLQNIGLQEPQAIGFDILFSEKDRFNTEALEQLGGLDAGTLDDMLPDGDGNFGAMLSLTPSVLALALSQDGSSETAFIPGSISVIGAAQAPVLEAPYLLSPTEALHTAPGAGFVSLSLERDSIVRYAPMVARFDDRLLPSFSAELLRVAQGANGHILKQSGETGEIVNQLKTGRIISKLDQFGRLPLYLGAADRFPVISAQDVLIGENLDRLSNAIVIIGSSATGLKDIQSTALDAAIPGPLIHLHILHQILSGAALTSSEITGLIEIGIFIFVGICLGLACLRLAVALSALLVAGVSMVAGYASFSIFINQMILTNAVANITILLITGISVIILRALSEEANRRQLRAAFGQYLSPEMVKDIEQSGQKPELGGTTTDISVFFLDIRGFTTLSETLADRPQDLTKIINHILDHCTEIILKHGGTLDKYIGDAIMAFWNAPIAQSDHALRATSAAIEIQNSLDDLNRALKTMMGDNWINQDISVGIGIATGPAVVGNFGSKQRLSYSVLGDTVNLAARLEPVVKQTGIPITVSNRTAEQAGLNDIHLLSAITVRGRREAEKIHGYFVLDTTQTKIQNALSDAASLSDKPTLSKLIKTHADSLSQSDYPIRLLDFYRHICDK